MIRHETRIATALFIGRDIEYDAENFTGQYEILLKEMPAVQVLAFAEQVHGDRAIEIPAKANRLHFAGEGDALFTGAAGVALLVRTADCIPIMFSSRTGLLLGAVHAGWRGLEKKILSKALAAAGARVTDCEFVVGPFIGSQSYEVGADVSDRFTEGAKSPKPGGKFFLNLRNILEAEFGVLGADKSQITWYDEDTLQSEHWYSARRGDKKRNLSVITARQN